MFFQLYNDNDQPNDNNYETINDININTIDMDIESNSNNNNNNNNNNSSNNIPAYDAFTLDIDNDNDVDIDIDVDVDVEQQILLMDSYQNNYVHEYVPSANDNDNHNHIANDISNRDRIIFNYVLLIYLPQVISSFIILLKHPHYQESIHNIPMCDEQHQKIWYYWVYANGIRLLCTTTCLLIGYIYRTSLQLQRYQILRRILYNTVGLLETISMVWFIIGNIIIFLPEQLNLGSCSHAENSQVYNLLHFLIYFLWFQFLFPIIALLLMIPISCLLIPCLISRIIHNI